MPNIILKVGDVLGFSGSGFISDFINCVTFGIPRKGLSHVAIVAPWKGDLILFESTTLDTEPCLITGKHTRGVQAHPLTAYEGYDGRVYLYPVITSVKEAALEKFVSETIGRPYDTFGAFRSGGLGLRASLAAMDLRTLFCSELVAASLSVSSGWRCGNASSLNPNHMAHDAIRDNVLGNPVRLK